jgi:hypothetical protein
MVHFVAELAMRPKGRAAVVLTHDYPGQKAWASELAMQSGVNHLHMLDLFSQDPNLNQNLSRFMVPVLFDFIHQKNEQKVLIVSGIEFIKATWSGQPSAINEFANRVRAWNLTPTILFVVQHDPTLASYDFGRRYRYRFIVDQRDTLKL